MSHLTILPIDLDELQALIGTAVRRAVDESIEELRSRYPRPFNPTESTLSRKETAQVLRLSLSTLRMYEKRGILKPMRLGRRVIYPVAEIERAFNFMLVSPGPLTGILR